MLNYDEGIRKVEELLSKAEAIEEKLRELEDYIKAIAEKRKRKLEVTI